MARSLSVSFLAVLLTSPAVFAQDGPLQQAGRALDNAGKNIRARIENEVARGQVTAQERELLYRVTRRLEWDKQLVRSTVQIEAQSDGSIVVRGSVQNESAKRRAVDLVENTVGVTKVVDELAVVKEVKVIDAKAATPVPAVTPSVPAVTPPVPARTVPPNKPE
jgi:hyperosmotically inducible protein